MCWRAKEILTIDGHRTEVCSTAYLIKKGRQARLAPSSPFGPIARNPNIARDHDPLPLTA